MALRDFEFVPEPDGNSDAMFEAARDAAGMMSILSHESRLLILRIVSDKERSVTEIERILDRPQYHVSTQLAVLRRHGLVGTRRNGKLVLYRIKDKRARVLVDKIFEVYCSLQTPRA